MGAVGVFRGCEYLSSPSEGFEANLRLCSVSLRDSCDHPTFPYETGYPRDPHSIPLDSPRIMRDFASFLPEDIHSNQNFVGRWRYANPSGDRATSVEGSFSLCKRS